MNDNGLHMKFGKEFKFLPIKIKKRNLNETEEHNFLKFALKKIMEVHFNCNCKTEFSIDELRFDVFGRNDERSYVGEIGTFNIPARKIAERFKNSYEIADVLFWIPLCDGRKENFGCASSYMMEIFDYIRCEPFSCETCLKEKQDNWMTFGRCTKPFIYWNGNLYSYWIFNLEHTFNPEIWHKKFEEYKYGQSTKLPADKGE